jgi:hypothetical protein
MEPGREGERRYARNSRQREAASLRDHPATPADVQARQSFSHTPDQANGSGLLGYDNGYYHSLLRIRILGRILVQDHNAGD